MLLNNNSLKRSLFCYLSACVLLVVIAVGLTAFFSTKEEIEEVFDANMVKSAKILYGLVKHDSKDNAQKLRIDLQNFDGDEIFHKYERKIHYQIWFAQNLIYNSDSRFALKARENQGFADEIIDGKKWRSFVFKDEKTKVMVLEEYEIRNELIAKILFYLLISFALSFPLLLTAIWLVIDRKLDAIKHLSEKISVMSSKKMRLDDVAPPLEIKPFVDSINSMLARLAESMESERRFTDYAAHELRTPIAVIKAQAQLLARNKNKEKESEYLQDLIKGVERMEHIVSQILTLARLEPDNKDIEKTDLDLKFLLQGVIENYKNSAAQKNILVIFKCDEATPILHENQIYLEICFSNLIDNAVKYSNENSQILCELLCNKNAKEKQLIVRITNEGKVLSEEEQNKVFDKFYRVENFDDVGCGLGLAIAKKIAELCLGQISFTSKKGVNVVEVKL